MLLANAACDRRDSSVRQQRADAEIPAALILVEGLDEEGGMIGPVRLSDTSLVAFFRDHAAFADARLAADYLAPGTRVDVVGSKLMLDGVNTDILVEIRNAVSFVPLRPLAERYRAYLRTEEMPGRMVTVWRNDVLCRYARDADRRAPVFLEAAEQGLLRQCNPPINAEVRRWDKALPNEGWAASVTLRQPVDSAAAANFLQQYDAEPYAVYGGVAGHHLIVRVSPDSASPRVMGQLNAAAIEALQRTLCGLPGALGRRGRGTVRRTQSPGVDAFHGERHMLVSVLAARRELPHVRVGAPIIYGFDVVATAADLQRLNADSRTGRFDPATKVDSSWVVPGTDMSVVAGVATPREVARLDSAALFTRLESEAALARNECARS